MLVQCLPTQVRRLRSLLCLCDVIRAPINSLVYWLSAYLLRSGDSGLFCVCVTSFERQLTPLCVCWFNAWLTKMKWISFSSGAPYRRLNHSWTLVSCVPLLVATKVINFQVWIALLTLDVMWVQARTGQISLKFIQTSVWIAPNVQIVHWQRYCRVILVLSSLKVAVWILVRIWLD